MKQKFLIIVDPQRDFIEGGSLAVEGARKAMDNLTEHLKGHSGEYSKIFVSLDTHNPTNLGFKQNWEGQVSGIIPGQPFPKDLIRSGVIQPRFAYTAEQDTEDIMKQPDFMCWPPHCIKGTEGHRIYGPLEEVLEDLWAAGKVEYLTKGESDSRDNYSIFHYGDGGLTCHANPFKLWDPKYSDPDIVIAGLALDYCVYETVKSLQKICDNGHYYLMASMGAAIRSQETVSSLYKALPKKVEIKL